MFVVIEGIEGSGKSTLVSALAERLRGEGHDVLVTREPGGTPLGDAVRKIFLDRQTAIEPLTEALLVNAARAQHVGEVIRPALAANKIVVCDRFTDSTIAYQGYGRGLDLVSIRAMCDTATEGLEPDLVLLVDVPVGLARARLQERSQALDRVERENDRFHELVRHGYLELAHSPRHRVLDGALPREPLLERALREVREWMNVRVR
jgi:dTMP kinase